MQQYKFLLEDFQSSIKNNDLPFLRLRYPEIDSQVTFDLLRLAPTANIEDFKDRIIHRTTDLGITFSTHQEYSAAAKKLRFEYAKWLINLFQREINGAGIRTLDEEEKQYEYPEIEERDVSCIITSNLDHRIFRDLHTNSNLSWVKREVIKFLDLILGEDWNDYTVYRLHRYTSWCSVNYSDYSPQELNTYFMIHNSGKEIWVFFLNVYWN